MCAGDALSHKLSKKKQDIAAHFGRAFARGILKDYAAEPIHFGSLEGLLSFVPGLAAVSLFTCLLWSPSEDEKSITARAAEDEIALVLSVAKTYSKNNRDLEQAK